MGVKLLCITTAPGDSKENGVRKPSPGEYEAVLHAVYVMIKGPEEVHGHLICGILTAVAKDHGPETAFNLIRKLNIEELFGALPEFKEDNNPGLIMPESEAKKWGTESKEAGTVPPGFKSPRGGNC